ncbi:MAG: GDP-mannose 4,6-dehydratase [Acidobacteria bacterium]|nr:GDP-mannose 4,6-dehydratase [Acidobacteriota bacterium]
MKVLVTGAGGFVGQHLSQALLSSGHEVTAATEDLQQVRTGLARIGVLHATTPSASWLEMDVTHASGVTSILARLQPDWIFHLAAITFVPQSFGWPRKTYRVNFLGTLNLLEAVRLRCPGARVVFVSSAAIYGTPQYLPVDEQHPLAPTNPYSGSKAAADLLSFQYSQSFGIDIVRVRPFNHIGPGQTDAFVVSSFARQIAEMELGLAPAVIRVGNLNVFRDFSDVRDVTRAYVAAVEKGERGAAYNICSGRSYSVRGLLDCLLAASRLENVTVEVDKTRLRPQEIREIRGSNQLAVEKLGWKPEIGIQQTLSACLDYWRGNLSPHGCPILDSK